jgi:hypothetical protein
MGNKYGVFAAHARVERGALVLKIFQNRIDEKIFAAVRPSLSSPQWPDTVHTRDARTSI